ncbi:MAG: hypothetical protein ABSG15_00500 [FCB group bacterium]|jgi:hypothetical protein
MKNIKNFIMRHAIWIALVVLALLLFQPGLSEIRTLLLIAAVESIALALSGISLYAYTKIDFTKELGSLNPGLIFLGVHICVGLVVMGVYIAQFAN